MNILEAAIRRILIRNTEKAILNTAKGLGDSERSKYRIVYPTVSNAIWSIIIMGIVVGGLVFLLLSVNLPILGFFVPLLFIFSVFKSFRGYTYDLKEEILYKSDRRYSTGRKIVGYQTVEDKTKKIEFTESEKLIGRVEGAAKMLIVFIAWIFCYTTFNSIENRIYRLSEKQVLNILLVGDTLYKKENEVEVFGLYKSTYNDDTVRSAFAEIKSNPIGILVSVDSTKVSKWLTIKPIAELKMKSFSIKSESDRIGNDLQVRLDDILISTFKYNSMTNK